jgi:hypothetical protein
MRTIFVLKNSFEMIEGEGKKSYRDSSSSIRGVVEPLLGDDRMLFNAKKRIVFDDW